MWQPRHMHLMHLLQSASFFTPTLGNELCLLTNNGAMSSEPQVHKNAPNSFLGTNWSPIIKQYTSPGLLIKAHPSTGQTLPTTLLGSLCLQCNHRSTPDHQPVSTLQRLEATALQWATLPSHSISPQHLSQANAALTQPAHVCTAHCRSLT